MNHRNRETTYSRSSRSVLLAALALVVSASAAWATSYTYGRVWDSWKISSGPANTGFKIQIRNNYGTWRTVDSGTTDALGDASGTIGPNLGPTTEGKFLVGHDDCVRIKWANGATWKMKVFGLPNYFVGQISAFNVGIPSITPPQAYEIRQNDPENVVLTGTAAWWQSGSTLRMRLPDHVTFASVPNVISFNPVGLMIGVPTLEDSGATLAIPILANQQLDPFDGVLINNAQIAYDGLGITEEYAAAVEWEAILTPSAMPFDVIDMGTGFDFVRFATVSPAAAIEWFDESNGGVGYPDFNLFEQDHNAWVGTAAGTVGFENLAIGEKLADQYAEHGVFFGGADGGAFNAATGVQVEGDPGTVENLTGYDGSYQPDGSLVYARMQNTTDNPDAPFTVEFHPARSLVAAFMATGVQGADHSFTITARDADGQIIDQKIVESELWELDPTGNNYETLFAVRSSLPLIRSITVTNNSTVQFADALIIDEIAFDRAVLSNPADGDRDGDVDLADFSAFEACLGGVGPNLVESACSRYDSDGDADVDLLDYARFQREFAGGP